MNKTRRRAIQKHRAKDAKFEIRRKSSGEQSAGRAKPAISPAAPQAAKPKTSTRRRGATDAAEQ